MYRKIIFFIVPVFFLMLVSTVQAGTVDDGHCVIGSEQGSTTWYFAEGCTRTGFNTFLCICNPNSKVVNARIKYFLGNGTRITKNQLVSANSRITLLLNDESQVGFRDDVSGDVSIMVESTTGLPIMVERPMYFEGTYQGGHDVMGVVEPSVKWHFAEGYTGAGFDEWVCIMNPGDANATVHFYFQTQEAGEIAREYLLARRLNELDQVLYQMEDQFVDLEEVL